MQNNIIDTIKKLTQDKLEILKDRKSVYISSEFLKKFGKFEGCSSEEIDELKKIQSVKRLPKLYEDFLFKLGKNNGGIIELDTYNQLLYHKVVLVELLESENVLFHLPYDAFVFYNDVGTRLDFFLTDNEEDDPPIYRYTEGEIKFEVVYKKLSLWFEAHIEIIRSRKSIIL